ncbi:hypothetical protein G6F21_006799 [Rhizopus arrhizus]|nr:hypothetical protein G6F21_006799 [Rhizopus arrhizus]
MKIQLNPFQDTLINYSLVHKSGPNCYLELNVDIEECHILVCKDELRFDNGLVVVRPGSVIKRVTLQCLPWLRPQRLLEGLRGTLGNYGGVRYVGIVTDSDTGAFFGSGKVNPTSSTLLGITPPIAESNADITGSTTIASDFPLMEVPSNTLSVSDDDESSDLFNAPTGLPTNPSANLIHSTDQRSLGSTNHSTYASPVKETEDSRSSTSSKDMILTDLP